MVLISPTDLNGDITNNNLWTKRQQEINKVGSYSSYAKEP